MLLVALACQSARAATYVGCFPAASFGSSTTPSASLAACEQSCASSKLPLVGMVRPKEAPFDFGQ